MKSTLRLVENATGLDKFVVLAGAVDRVIEDQKSVTRDQGLDLEIETLEMEELAKKFETTVSNLRTQIEKELGISAVFKCGKKWVIRKRTFFEYLQAKEGKLPTNG